MSDKYLSQFKHPLKILGIFGLWKPKREKVVLGFVATLAFIAINTISPIVFIFKSDSFDEEPTNIFFIYLGLSFKIVNFLLRIGAIEDLYEDLVRLLDSTKPRIDSKRENILKHERFMTRVLFIYIGSILISASLDITVPMFEDKLPYKVWIPYNYRANLFVFWLTSVMQIVFAMVGSTVAICIESIAIFFMALAGTLLAELAERMETLSETGTADEKHSELVKCVESHLKIKKFVSKIEKQFSNTFLTQSLTSASFICLSAYLMSRVSVTNPVCSSLIASSTDFTNQPVFVFSSVPYFPPTSFPPYLPAVLLR
jgi:hypothetical protein